MDLSKKQGHAYCYLEGNNEVTEVMYGGAAGGGKSWFGCFWQILRRIKYEGTRGLIGRSQLKNLKQTTLKTFFEVAKDHFNMWDGNGFSYKAQSGEIHFDNGSEIILKDLFLYPSDPDFQSLGSMEITDAFIDEASEITLKAFEIVNSRIRYKLHLVNGVPKILLATNPQHNWIKFRYVLTPDNRPIQLKPYQRFVSAKVSDNPDEEFKRLYTSQLQKLNKYDKARLLDGDWIVNKNDHPFFHQFNRDKHIANEMFELDTLEDVWISFDFNVNPTTAIIGQKIIGKGLFFYKVHQVYGGTRELCRSELMIYRDYLLRITGDRSGNSGNTAAGLVAGQLNTDYFQIKLELDLSDYQLINTTKQNKAHTHSRSLCNAVLDKIPVYINPLTCEGLINDLETAQPTKQGKLLKDRENHKQDVGDAFRYMISAWFPNGMRDVNAFASLLISVK